MIWCVKVVSLIKQEFVRVLKIIKAVLVCNICFVINLTKAYLFLLAYSQLNERTQDLSAYCGTHNIISCGYSVHPDVMDK